MPSKPKFEDLVAQAREAGVDTEWLSNLEAAYEASPLRQELKDTKALLETATQRAQNAETGILGSHFERLGIKAKPTAFALPDDLDRTDGDQVAKWAVDQGLIDPPETVPGDQLDAQDRIAAASAGAGAVNPSAADALLNPNLSEEQFYELAEQAGVLQG